MIIAFVGGAYAHHLKEETIAERTKPAGKVYREGDKIPTPAVVVSSSKNRSVDETYKQKCALCHDNGIAGSPKMGDVAVWKDRIAQGEETLFKHAIEGFQGGTGVMPAKGGCVDCSDDEIKLVVKYMIEKSQ